uniref:Uncharacterized protein n=1 Tax=Periophthalmus magnuspinnatus TaxID=409849 RepID=A0A3B3ZU67_9GOBI
IMKYVALALALLLAIGCQAASLQADAPSQLEHARGLMRMYLDQVKNSLDNIASKVDDEQMKSVFHTAAILNHAQSAHDAVATLSDATADLRASISTDIETLKKELEPLRTELHAVVNKHIEEYRALLQPIMEEQRAKQEAEMAAWKAKLEPVMEELRAKISVNVEETKSKLLPIIEKVREKITERVESVKAMVDPYVQEYKEQMKQAYTQVGSLRETNFEEVKQKLAPHVESVKTSVFASKDTNYW